MKVEVKHCILLALLAVASILAVWWPFLSRGEADVLFRYWDGPSYVTVAYSLYARENPVYGAYGFGPEFYAAHFPAYPLAIRLLSFLGYFNSMFLATVVFAVLAVIAFYFLSREFMEPESALLLSAVFVFFPPRWLLYHSVGATEPLFLFASISSVFFFRRKQFAYAGLFGALASLTRITGMLLFPALAAALLFQQWKERALLKNLAWLCLIPLPALGLFSFYYLQFGDLSAALQTNSAYFQGLYSAITVFRASHAAELTLLLFGAYFLGMARLWQRKRFEMLAVCLAFVAPLLFIAHNDVSRYLLPAAPYALLLAFDDALEPMLHRKSFWLAFALLLGATYVYVWDAVPRNLMPYDAFEKLLAVVGK